MAGRTLTAQRRSAEALAAEALAFLAVEPSRLGRFLALTGTNPATIREAVRDPAFLAAVLDHIVADEPLLLAFAEESGRSPSEVLRCRTLLGGPDWERDTA